MSGNKMSNNSGMRLSDDVSVDKRFADYSKTQLPGTKIGERVTGDRTAYRYVGPGPKNSGSGFSFVELLVVVAIISILVVIALPAYRDYLQRAKVAESLTFLGDAKNPVNEFYSRWGRMPADNSEAGLRQPDDLRGNYVRSVTVQGGVIVASLDLGNDSEHQPIVRTLTFRPWINTESTGSPIVWSCGRQDPGVPSAYQAQGSIAANPVQDKWVPAICRTSS